MLHRKKTDIGYSIPVFPQLKPLIERFMQQGKIRVGEPLQSTRALRERPKDVDLIWLSPVLVLTQRKYFHLTRKG